MGVVYRAYDPQLDREVAIKTMHLEGGPQLKERFFKEARAAAKLNHPNIVAVHDVLEDAGTAYIVMELIDPLRGGGSLQAHLAARGPMTVPEAARILSECASALDFAHGRGLVHRDIKPANILLDEQGRAKIVDFGIAKRLDVDPSQPTTTAPGTTVGTLGYMAPEQILGQPVDGRADQYSLGVVGYQMLTGRMPFEAPTWVALSYKILHESPQPVAALVPGAAASASQAVERAMARDRNQRFATCSQFTQAFSGSADPATLPLPHASASRRNPTPAIAAILALIAVAVGGWFWMSRGQKQDVAIQPPIAYTPPSESAQPAGGATSVSPNRPKPADPAATDPLKMVIDGIDFNFAAIPAGQFMMGNDAGYANPDEKPRHLVRITKPFEIGVTEVTAAQWAAVNGQKPPAKGGSLPKLGVSYQDAEAFLRKLNTRGDGYRYRLPTEAEWEYAARAGTTKELYGDLDAIAWYQSGSATGPIDVGQREPNAWGLFDTIGNAWEWVSDWYGEEYYANSPKADPKGAPEGQYRVIRGGSFNAQGMILRVTYRAAAEPGTRGEDYGFRIVRVKN
jgi:serine/threonine protein kinase